jgi:hypothetical protein
LKDVDDRLDLKGVGLEDDSLVLGEVLFSLEPLYTLLLILLDAAHLLPYFVFFASEL